MGQVVFRVFFLFGSYEEKVEQLVEKHDGRIREKCPTPGPFIRRNWVGPQRLAGLDIGQRFSLILTEYKGAFSNRFAVWVDFETRALFVVY